MSEPVNPHIFREYDIRGVAERDLTDDLARDLGRAVGTFQRRHGNHRLALGRDCRHSSPRLHEVLLEGLRETGVTVIDLGIVPTPLVYFAVFHLDLAGAVQITGSHNPPPENGFKMMRGKGSLFGEDIQRLRQLVEDGDFDLPGGGSTEPHDVLPAYIGYMRGNIRLPATDVGFAVDAGNGTAGPAAIETMQALGLHPVELLCEMDPDFPVHHPDPTDPDNLELLTRTIRERDLELGIALDGDGDRIGVVDSHGDVIWGDRLLVILARALLRDRPGAGVLGDVKCSKTLYDDIETQGGRPILWKTGHSLIKTKMKEEGALLAGEMSGHIFFGDRYYGFDDAIYASLRLLEILATERKSLQDLLAGLPEVHATPEIRVECPDDRKFDVVQEVLERFRRTHDVVDVDGARILFEGGWGLVRASNTQPVLVLRFEATDADRLAHIRREVEQAVEDATP